MCAGYLYTCWPVLFNSAPISEDSLDSAKAQTLLTPTAQPHLPTHYRYNRNSGGCPNLLFPHLQAPGIHFLYPPVKDYINHYPLTGKTLSWATFTLKCSPVGALLSTSLSWGGQEHILHTLVNSGAAGNFMCLSLAKSPDLPGQPWATPNICNPEWKTPNYWKCLPPYRSCTPVHQ